MQKQDWNDRTEVKKGNIGESIVTTYLENKGYVVYEPVTDKAHHFDKVISKDKKFLAIAEVKTYEMLKFKDETGINLKNYKEYLDIKNLDVFIFFVDSTTNREKESFEELHSSIYGNKLIILSEKTLIKGKEYPYVMRTPNGLKMMFHLSKMKKIGELTKDQCLDIKKYSKLNNKYK